MAAPAQIALYSDAGSWDLGKEHLKLFFQQYGFSYTTLSAQDIQQGKLQSSGVQLLVMPEGESWTYLNSLGSTGAENILNFVSGGGRYFGVCAGAFYAVSHRDVGYANGDYGIGLLNGVAYDGTSLHNNHFKDGILGFDFLIQGFQSLYRIMLLGGPSFHYSPEEASKKQIQVLAKFEQTQEPAMILYRYNHGKVFLSGPHLEIEEGLIDWGPEYQDPDSEWPVLNWVVSQLLEP